MVWFYCGACGDTVKKPKLANHCRSCASNDFTCVDCSRSFDRASANGHTSCVTEHEKYALAATKPGGYAAQGCFKEGGQQQPAAAAGEAEAEAVGLEFLSQRPPWRCSCCNVSCTSRDTLLGHAAGAKHKRRARAAARAVGGITPDAAAAQAEQRQATGQQQPSRGELAEAAAARGTQQQGKEQPAARAAAGTAAADAASTPAALPQLLLRAASKRLKRKGRLGVKKLVALLNKRAAKAGTEQPLSDELVQGVKAQLLAMAEVQLQDSKMLLWQQGAA